MKTVKASELTTMRMVAGNEEKYDAVITPNGNLKEWVGIGWIHIRHATDQDRLDYPTVVEDES